MSMEMVSMGWPRSSDTDCSSLLSLVQILPE